MSGYDRGLVSDQVSIGLETQQRIPVIVEQEGDVRTQRGSGGSRVLGTGY